MTMPAADSSSAPQDYEFFTMQNVTIATLRGGSAVDAFNAGHVIESLRAAGNLPAPGRLIFKDDQGQYIQVITGEGGLYRVKFLHTENLGQAVRMALQPLDRAAPAPPPPFRTAPRGTLYKPRLV